MKIEYLAIISADSSFCRNVSSFKSFLQSDSDIKITSRRIKYQALEVDYELQTGLNEEQNHIFYHLRLKSESDDVDAISNMSRAIRKLLYMASNGNVQNLWDDISFHYAQISYPYIHEIENLMRKLITKFMLTNVGLGWTKDTVPEGIRKSPRFDKNGSNNNYLYEVDFIQLSDFLFNEYRTLELSALIKKLSGIKTQTVDVDEISDFIPRSNWKRYFEPHVDCDASYLESRWKKLYDLRCKIAHNNSFNKSDYEQTVQLSTEVKEKLEKAIASLDAISVPEEERDELVESVIGHTSQEAAALLNQWRSIDSITREYAKRKIQVKNFKRIPSDQIFATLYNDKIISKDTFQKLRELRNYRDYIAHSGMVRHYEDAMSSNLEELEKLTQALSKKLTAPGTDEEPV
ncbi:MAG: hypothetical protein AB1588_13005 [Pseudomonadota bacterium]